MLNAEQWELYIYGMEKTEQETEENASIVANRLNSYISEAINSTPRLHKQFEYWQDCVASDPVAIKFGAYDSEPMYMAKKVLADAAGVKVSAVDW